MWYAYAYHIMHTISYSMWYATNHGILLGTQLVVMKYDSTYHTTILFFLSTICLDTYYMFCVVSLQGVISVTGLDTYSNSATLFIQCPSNSARKNIPPCTYRSSYTRVGSARIVKIPITSITSSQITFNLASLQTIRKAIRLTLKVTHETPKFDSQIYASVLESLLQYCWSS